MTYRLPVYKLRLVRDHIVSYPAMSANAPQLAALFFYKLIGNADREHIAALFLDCQGKPTGSTIIGIGALSGAQIHTREVFKGAILANASRLILSHNHPSNDPTPSPDDISLHAQSRSRWAAPRDPARRSHHRHAPGGLLLDERGGADVRTEDGPQPRGGW